MLQVSSEVLTHYTLTHSSVSMASVVGAAVAKDPSLIQKDIEVSMSRRECNVLLCTYRCKLMISVFAIFFDASKYLTTPTITLKGLVQKRRWGLFCFVVVVGGFALYPIDMYVYNDSYTPPPPHTHTQLEEMRRQMALLQAQLAAQGQV